MAQKVEKRKTVDPQTIQDKHKISALETQMMRMQDEFKGELADMKTDIIDLKPITNEIKVVKDDLNQSITT